MKAFKGVDPLHVILLAFAGASTAMWWLTDRDVEAFNKALGHQVALGRNEAEVRKAAGCPALTEVQLSEIAKRAESEQPLTTRAFVFWAHAQDGSP